MKFKFLSFLLICSFFIQFSFCENVNFFNSNKNIFGKEVKTDSNFELSWAVDIPLSLASLTTFSLSQILEGENYIYNPYQNRDLNKVNSFDRWSAQKYSKSVDITSDILMFSTLCLPLSLLATETSEYLTWTVMYTESVLLCYGIKDLIKLGVYRERPYMYFEDKPMEQIEEGDYCNSFLSGHSSMSFMGATFASYTFSKYFPDSKWKLPIILGSYTLAGLTTTLRVVAGCHFFSDVLAGATLGTVIGVGVPFLHEINSIINNKINKKIVSDKIEQVSFNLSPTSIYCVINL